MRTFVCDCCGNQVKNGTPSGYAHVESGSRDLEIEMCKKCADQLLDQLENERKRVSDKILGGIE